ncbi:MAG: hypothetical protein JF589_09415 [Gemmatimonadetes bacterium]|jgi:hypothetical protein|nr:hypothetical protein [Gemmatimonadota bacterium]
MSIAHRFSVAALAAALVALHPATGRAQEQEQAKPAAGQTPPPAPLVVSIAAEEQRRLVGDYDISLPDGQIMGVRVFVEEGQLFVAPEEQEKTPMRYFGNNTFGLDFDPTLRLTFDVANGKVTGGKLVQRGMTMHVFRRP